MGLRIAGFACLAAALALIGFVLYRNSPASNIPLVFSPTQVLGATWDSYKAAYVEAGSGRTIDPSRGNITTSEGESYTMLRAVWLGDKQTFDSSWQFTKSNLEHKNDALFSWLYGKRPDGTYGVLTAQHGDTSASDADQDIALALVFAYARWQDPAYLSDAKSIVSDIWDKEVVTVRGTPYLVADDKEKTSTKGTVLINPSYLSPYSYRLFSKIDPAHPWASLTTSSYALLTKSITAPLGSSAGGLPPDWLALDMQTGALHAAGQSYTSDYGYDAMRVPWRLALDWQWNHDPRAKDVLLRMSTLRSSWQKQAALDTVYSHAGTPTGQYESPSMYGGAIGYFMLADASDASKVYENKLVFLYNPDSNTWKEPLSYYDDNWAWFGIALYNNLLPNLAADLPQSAFASTTS